jgi:hypothetical protein
MLLGLVAPVAVLVILVLQVIGGFQVILAFQAMLVYQAINVIVLVAAADFN